MKPLRFFNEAIDFHHLVQCTVGPPFPVDDFLNLTPKFLNVLRACGQIEQGMRERLHIGLNSLQNVCFQSNDLRRSTCEWRQNL